MRPPRITRSSVRRKIKTYGQRLLIVIMCLLTILTPSASALTNDQKNLLQSGVHYFDISGTDCSAGAATSGATSDTALTGSDNQQKAFNYFKNKGQSDIIAAAITANLQAESSINPKSNQGGGPGMGIAQWGNPGRWNDLEAYASQQHADKFSLALQLDFLWKELNKNYASVMDKVTKQTNVSDATAFFMGTAAAGMYPGNVVDPVTQSYIGKYGRQAGFENPGSPHLDVRIGYAKTILKNYGDGVVSGADTASGCVTTGAVNCTSPTTADNSATNSANLSSLRQNVVCLTEAELQKWQNGEMKTGGDFEKYTQGHDEEWCADFASWIYNQAGYPIGGSSSNWRVPAVDGIAQIGKDGQRFVYHSPAGYTPVPGDLVIHGYSHVNIVVSVNTSKHSITLIGGNQDGSTTANTSSKVSEYTVGSYSGDRDSIIGYVSPKE